MLLQLSSSSRLMVLVILDIGSRFIRAGIPGYSVPREKFVKPVSRDLYIFQYDPTLLFPPNYDLDDLSMTEFQRQQIARNFLSNPIDEAVSRRYTMDARLTSIATCLHPLLLDLLLSMMVNPSTVRAVLIEPSFLSSLEKQEFSALLFMELGFRSVAWISEPVMETIASGGMSSLVVHMGWLSTVISSISDLRILNSKENDQFSGKVVHYKVLEELLKLGNAQLNALLELESGFELIENFIQSFYIGGTESSDVTDFFEFTDLIRIPSSTRHKIILSLVQSSKVIPDILSIIKKNEVDVRSVTLNNIIITGGLSNISGLQQYILGEIRQTWAEAIANISLGSWVGASIYFSSLDRDELNEFNRANELTREKFRRDMSGIR